jgi:hypothetical protein
MNCTGSFVSFLEINNAVAEIVASVIPCRRGTAADLPNRVREGGSVELG